MKPGLPSWIALECSLSIYEFSFVLKKFNVDGFEEQKSNYFSSINGCCGVCQR